METMQDDYPKMMYYFSKLIVFEIYVNFIDSWTFVKIKS